MHHGARAATISVADIISQMGKDAGLNGEELGPRTVQTVHLGLSRLEVNGLIQMLDSKLEFLSLTDKFKTLIQQLSDMYKEHLPLIQNLDSLSRSRIQCAFFRSKFRTRAFKKQATRRELECENKKIKLDREEHRKVCPLTKTRAPSVFSEATEMFEETSKVTVPLGSNDDNVYVHDILMNKGSHPIVLLPRTPARSGTLNNPEAYPSPQSAPRQTSSAPSTSYLTPSRSTSAPAPALAEEIGTDEDEEMEVTIELQEPFDTPFASDAPAVDSLSPLDPALTEQASQRIVQQHQIKEQARMKSRRRSRLFVRYRHTLERKRWWRALECSRREYEQLKKESELRERQLTQRHYEELRNVQNGHEAALRELDRRHAEEKKELENANDELRRRVTCQQHCRS
ncbi:hypothetical protein JR316_0008004 [Psilocybe cubensis]|uniref:Uncharacterized protein n=2 Tax=Psilocybe cubensis TaxID=181762 RepID=A0A8H7XVG8_PSICU|nr:hypothetical protein JR316_0008004 [Psilocybe cubensis]KAH9479414.1 hypothetical protein JR316_0008004 [Psilocybe cubensis]